MKKVFALLLVSVFAFCMVGCGEDEEEGCTSEAAQACLDDYNLCAADAGLDALLTCTTAYCDCLEGLGCDVTDICATSDAGV
jgi:hypothetical protein